MNTPVSFQLAKLLKEKGYIETCEKVYRSDGLLYTPSVSGSKLLHSNILEDESLSAPIISDVVMWLHKEHKIWISVDPDNDTDTWFYTISHNKSEIVFGNYSGPTEAYEAAIEHVLTSMI